MRERIPFFGLSSLIQITVVPITHSRHSLLSTRGSRGPASVPPWNFLMFHSSRCSLARYLVAHNVKAAVMTGICMALQPRLPAIFIGHRHKDPDSKAHHHLQDPYVYVAIWALTSCCCTRSEARAQLTARSLRQARLRPTQMSGSTATIRDSLNA